MGRAGYVQGRRRQTECDDRRRAFRETKINEEAGLAWRWRGPSPDRGRRFSMPGMPKADSATMERFTALLPKDPRNQIRPMFGHRAAFVNGRMFAGTFGTDIVVRLDEDARAELLAVSGARIFAPMKGRPMKEYVMLPARWLA